MQKIKEQLVWISLLGVINFSIPFIMAYFFSPKAYLSTSSVKTQTESKSVILIQNFTGKEIADLGFTMTGASSAPTIESNEPILSQLDSSSRVQPNSLIIHLKLIPKDRLTSVILVSKSPNAQIAYVESSGINLELVTEENIQKIKGHNLRDILETALVSLAIYIIGMAVLILLMEQYKRTFEAKHSGMTDRLNNAEKRNLELGDKIAKTQEESEKLKIAVKKTNAILMWRVDAYKRENDFLKTILFNTIAPLDKEKLLAAIAKHLQTKSVYRNQDISVQEIGDMIKEQLS
jgi:hypothetical protein